MKQSPDNSIVERLFGGRDQDVQPNQASPDFLQLEELHPSLHRMSHELKFDSTRRT
jgi:hypothetical protein